MTILRMLPLALFGAFGGALVERVQRRTIMQFGLSFMLVLALIIGYLEANNALLLWHLALASFLGGIFWAADLPIRRTLLGEVAGVERVGNAMSFDAITNNGTRMVGPVLGGVLLEQIGLHGTYFLGAFLYGVSMLVIMRLPDREKPAGVAAQVSA